MVPDPESDRAKGFRPDVALLLVSDRKILLGKRVGKDTKDPRKTVAWDIPQGGIETGESLTDAVLREIREELGHEWLEKTGEPRLLAWTYLEFRIDKEGEHWRGKTYYFHIVPLHESVETGPVPEFSGGVSFFPYNEARKNIAATQKGKKGRMLLGILDKLKSDGVID